MSYKMDDPAATLHLGGSSSKRGKLRPFLILTKNKKRHNIETFISCMNGIAI